ncbi:DNA methyltransferase [Thiolapillus sp.]
MASQVVSKKRVADHGEVYTREREVNAMLDLVKHETQRIESRFLEPACGTGNFLIEVLNRKLQVVETRYKRSQSDYERYAFIAVSSLYGIDILQDNIEACRQRLFEYFDAQYTRLFKGKCKEAFREIVRFLLRKNLIHGDALSLQTVEKNPRPIIFSEWSAINTSKIKRRDFVYAELVSHASLSELPLFSDLGEEVFVPRPVKEYPPVHYLRIADVD